MVTMQVKGDIESGQITGHIGAVDRYFNEMADYLKQIL